MDKWSLSGFQLSEFGFALLYLVIGSKFSRHFFNQSEGKPKPIVDRECTFSCILCRIRVITSSFDWFTGLSPSFWFAKVITLVLVLRHSIETRSKQFSLTDTWKILLTMSCAHFLPKLLANFCNTFSPGHKWKILVASTGFEPMTSPICNNICCSTMWINWKVP